LAREYAFENLPRTSLRRVVDLFEDFLKHNSGSSPGKAFAYFVATLKPTDRKLAWLYNTRCGPVVARNGSGIRLMLLSELHNCLSEQSDDDSFVGPRTHYAIRSRSRGARGPVNEKDVEAVLTGDQKAWERCTEGMGMIGRFGGFLATSVKEYEQLKRSLGSQPGVRPFMDQFGLAYSGSYMLLAVRFKLSERGKRAPLVPTVFDVGERWGLFRPAWRNDCWGQVVCPNGRDDGFPICIVGNRSFGTPVPNVLGPTPPSVSAPGTPAMSTLLSRSQEELASFTPKPRCC
jgi:hypothetical protein